MKLLISGFILLLIFSCSEQSGKERYQFKLVEYYWYHDSVFVSKVLEKESDSTLRLMIKGVDASEFYRIPNEKTLEEHLNHLVNNDLQETFLSGVTNELYDGGYYFLKYTLNGRSDRFFFLPHYAPKELKLFSDMLDSLYFSPEKNSTHPFDFRKGLEELYNDAKRLHPPSPTLDSSEFKPPVIYKS